MRIFPATTALLCCVLAAWRLCAADISAPSVKDGTQRQEVAAPGTGVAESVDRFMDEMERLDRRIHELEFLIEGRSTRIAGLEAERKRDEEQLASLRKDSASFLRNAGARLTILYKFKLLGYLTSLFSASDIQSAAGAGSLAAGLLENDHRLFLDLRKRATDVRRLTASIDEKGREADDLRSGMNEWTREISSAKNTKLGLLTRIDRQEDLYAKYSTKLEESQKTLERRAFSRKPVFDSRDRPFSSRQGSLPVPAAGEIVETFNSKMDAGSRSILYNNGIIITAAKGKPIRAIHEGVVMFADWFKEYGKVMIIDHGEHYYSLIAHAEQFLKNTGDVVKSGETIATVGNTGSPAEPRLYFEIRHYGKPVDPKEWLALQ